MSTKKTVEKKGIKKIIVCNTKGGCGKSITSQHILPFYFFQKNNGFDALDLSIFEIDATNKSRENFYTNSCVKYHYNKLNNSEEIKDIFIDSFFDEDSNSIFDIGGGRDSFEAIESLLEVESGIEDFLFLIPFFLSDDSFSGAYEVFERIIAKAPKANILFVANKMPYHLDSGRVPQKLYLSDDDVLRELEKVGINSSKLTDAKLHFSYIPELIATLPSFLFSEQGCCLDFCKELLEGISANNLRAEAKNTSKEITPNIDEQKRYYASQVKIIQRKADLYSSLGYCKPLFEKINNFK